MCVNLQAPSFANEKAKESRKAKLRKILPIGIYWLHTMYSTVCNMELYLKEVEYQEGKADT